VIEQGGSASLDHRAGSKLNIFDGDGNRCTECGFPAAGGTNGLQPSLKGQPKRASGKNAPRYGFARRIEKID
jgi:hypothetical protein